MAAAFENLINQLLQEEGFWTLQNVKIELSKEEKIKISKPTTPRPDIDIVAFDSKNNTLYLLEVKSFIDSQGVKSEEVFIEQKVQKR